MTMAESVAGASAAVDLLVLGGAILLCALLARGLARIWISTALLLVVLGVVVGPSFLGWFDLSITSPTVKELASLALATVLFSDATRTDLASLRLNAVEPVRLLTIGLIGSIVLGAVIALPLLPALTLPLALALGATLAPTDAALGAPVVSDPAVPAKVRQVLTVESGLNDGLAVPILLLALGMAGLQDNGGNGFVRVLVSVLGAGALVGVVLSAGVAAVWVATRRRWGVSGQWTPLVPLLTAVGCYLLAEELGGSGFIAAFVGGLTFGFVCRGRVSDELDVDENVSNLLQAATWFIFGALVVGVVITHTGFDWRWLVYAVLSLTVVRALPVALALIGTKEKLPTVAFMAWFGPRGLASVVFLFVVLDAAPATPVQVTFFGTVTITVMLSILLHGISARPWAKAYGAWAQRHG